jgi:mono/diheme cytochrome c family protein
MQTSVRLRRVIICSSLIATFQLAAGTHTSAADKVDFNREILPILSTTCFRCHGPDQNTRKAELRLDDRENAVGKKKAIAPGKPDESDLIARITSEDDDERMPPPKAGPKLSADQIATLRKWIEQGAGYAEHWAFIPPERPTVPAVQNQAWTQSPIDRFVLAQQEQQKLKPAERASREVLIRRATLDLIGLPPTPQEIDEFVNDKSPDAFEKLVDRLLASPHYGERWAGIGSMWPVTPTPAASKPIFSTDTLGASEIM